MAEYIEKKHTCGKCIFKKKCERLDYAEYSPLNDACTEFLNAADVVEVVRCGECVHNYGIKANCEFNPHDIVCDWWSTDGMDKTDFCSRGERRSE